MLSIQYKIESGIFLGLLDSVDSCRNRKESRKNAKETFRRMKKYLFSHRRSNRQTRSVLTDLLTRLESRKSQETFSEPSNSDNHRMGRMKGGHKATSIDLAKVQHVPSEFYTIATSSNMDLSRFSKHHSLSQTSDASKTRSTRTNKRNYKRRKSLFKKSSLRGNSSEHQCPVFLYSDSHGLTCMCKS